MSTKLAEILESAATQEALIEHLKEISPVYPEIIEVNVGKQKQIYASTIVRVLDEEGIWRRVHVVESVNYKPEEYKSSLKDVIKQLTIHAYITSNLYAPHMKEPLANRLNPVDSDQRDEKERLKDMVEAKK